MLSFFKKDPIKTLRKQYAKKLEAAMYAQRSGDIRSYSLISSEAEDLRLKIEALEKSKEA